MADSTANAEKKIITVRSSDGELFEMDQAAALVSQTIKHMIEDDCANATIPLPNVTSKTLSKIIEYCNKHANTDEESLKAFDKEFVDVDQALLFDLVLASNFLNIKSLLDITCQAIADMIKDKSVEYVRALFNIHNDFSPKEEADIREENAWAFE